MNLLQAAMIQMSKFLVRNSKERQKASPLMRRNSLLRRRSALLVIVHVIPRTNIFAGFLRQTPQDS